MEAQAFHNFLDRRSITRSRAPATKWVKEWVPQDLVATGGKCLILKWVNEATLKALKENSNETEAPDAEPEPATEVLFLCSYEGCGKTFIDAGALRKHSHIHGDRQYVCHYENCGKKFLDSSKLKRHFLTHTGERAFVCPVEGCGKAFSLDFNLKSHMRTHSQENYHICPFPECGKRYAHEYKLKNHIATSHQKNAAPEVTKYAPPPPTIERPTKTPKSSGGVHASSSDRPYICPYEGCDKAYIHEYKLNLHLRKEHPGHFPDDSANKNAQPLAPSAAVENGMMDEESDKEAYGGKHHGNGKTQKQSRPKPNLKMPPAKVANRKSSGTSQTNLNVVKKPWPVNDVRYEEDSEETEEERDGVGDGYRYWGPNNDDDEDDEETEYED